MKLRCCLTVLACFATVGTPWAKATPEVITYQGRVLDDGVNFDGAGFFKFSVVDDSGTPLWHHDGTSISNGFPTLPTSSLKLVVDNGLFTIALGDSSLSGMVSLPLSILDTNSPRFLRVWFSETGVSFTQLSPDQELFSVPYAYRAATVQPNAIAVSELNTSAVDGRYVNVSGDTMTGKLTVDNQLEVVFDAAFLRFASVGENLEIGTNSGTDNDTLFFDQGSGFVRWNETLGSIQVFPRFQVLGPSVFNASISPDNPSSSATCGTSGLPWENVFSRNALNVVSDRRLKTEVASLDYGLATVKALRPVSFQWRDRDDGRQLGFIAQEVLEVVPEVVQLPEDASGNLTVQYSALIPTLTRAIQEQQSVIEAQATQLALQAEQLARVLGRLDELEAASTTGSGPAALTAGH